VGFVALLLRTLGLCALATAAGCSRSAPPPDATAATRGPRPGDSNAPAVPGRAPSGTVNGITAAGAIVVLEPRTDRTYPPQARPPVMDQVVETFTPDVLFARTGQPVEFRNSDDTLHNVHVTNEETREPAFNVAIPTGEQYAHTFQKDGFYHVGCDIHPGMSAEVVVTSTPFATLAEADGRFSFVDVPVGAYTVRAVSSRGRSQQDLEVRSGVNAVSLTDSAGSR
jgi:plastocyanin